MFDPDNTLFRVFLKKVKKLNFAVSKSGLFLHRKSRNEFYPAYTSSFFTRRVSCDVFM